MRNLLFTPYTARDAYEGINHICICLCGCSILYGASLLNGPQKWIVAFIGLWIAIGGPWFDSQKSQKVKKR